MSNKKSSTGAYANATPAEVIGSIAPEAIRSILLPGPAIATRYRDTHEPMSWQVTSFEDTGDDTYSFVCESSSSLRAKCSVRLDRDHRVAVHRATLTNISNQRTQPMNEASALCLQLEGVRKPAVFLCTGAGSKAGWPHGREYPPDAFRTQWMWPVTPRPVHLESGARGAHQLVSSTEHLPIFMVRPEFESGGPGFYIGIEWSTRWTADISYGADRTGQRIVIGPAIKQMVLEGGESIELPAVHIGFFEGDFSEGTNACRRYINQRITPQYMDKPMVPPVVYTLWGSPQDYKQEHVLKQADVAAAMGVEMFCCDQDWFVGGHPSGIGNWEVDLQRFPEGLEPVAEYVRSKGMGMGLYFESYACDDSKFVREHPEFFLTCESSSTGRYMFNFGNRDACDYWTDLISRYVEQLDLRFIRADFGGYPIPKEGALTWDEFDPDDKLQFAYVEGKYRVWETLLERHPKLMWELNAGGGNCTDLGSMRRHHCSWGSDMMQMHVARMMQLGIASFVPGNFMGEAIINGPKGPNASDAGLTDIAFLSRMAGSFYVCGCIDTWPEDARERGRRWIRVYKRVRHLLVRDFYRLLPQPQSDQDWDAAQFCDSDREGIVFAFRHCGRTERKSLLLQGVDDAATYKVTDEASGAQQEIAGSTLRDEGLAVSLSPISAKLFAYSRM